LISKDSKNRLNESVFLCLFDGGFFITLWQTVANTRQILSKEFAFIADKVIKPA